MKNRVVRVSEVLKRELGVLFERELELRNALVTISGVDMTPDLKQAHVFISVLGNPAQRRAAMELLEKRRADFQAGFARRVAIKQTPTLHFHLDGSLERGSRVLGLMDELGLSEEPPHDDH